jgi:putative cardiolipin synthase
MLLDYFMVKNKFTPFFAHEMAKYGIEVKYYNVTSLLNIFKGQYRNHRKLLIVDGNEVITGGRNIGDEYFDLSDKFNFLDRDIKIRGSIVTHIQDTFNKVWDSKQTRILKRQKEPAQNDPSYSNSNKGAFGYDHDKFRQDLSNWKRKVIDAIEFLTKKDNRFVDEDLRAKAKSILAREYHGICNKMSFNSEYPLVGKASRKERVIKHDISERIKNAKEKILFDSPYFIVDDESQSALKEALDNQTQVVLLTNSLHSTDAIYVYAAFDNLIKNHFPHIEKNSDGYKRLYK